MATSQPEDKAEELIDEGAAKAKAAVSAVSKRAASTKAAAEDALHEGQDALEGAVSCAKDCIRANPLASVAVVAAIAYLWGRIRS